MYLVLHKDKTYLSWVTVFIPCICEDILYFSHLLSSMLERDFPYPGPDFLHLHIIQLWNQRHIITFNAPSTICFYMLISSLIFFAMFCTIISLIMVAWMGNPWEYSVSREHIHVLLWNWTGGRQIHLSNPIPLFSDIQPTISTKYNVLCCSLHERLKATACCSSPHHNLPGKAETINITKNSPKIPKLNGTSVTKMKSNT